MNVISFMCVRALSIEHHMLLDTEGVGFGFLSLGTHVITCESMSLLLSQPNVGTR